MTEIPLRIKVLRPPSGVAFALQDSKNALKAPSKTSAADLTFDVTVRVRGQAPDDEPDPGGSFVHGRRGQRFLYINSGTLAGQADSPWTRRAKVPLTGLTWTQIEEAQGSPDAVLEARIEGTANDGGPACAGVPLLDGGWTVAS